ncbi:Possible transcriptional regulator, TetR family protein [Hoyosella subflava DQS3-9A1]|uniref:Possible transcriptional regulator, TetR family protein n=1 Tax=Hoyosella subflava (strain DSM 45089 / JCM 17490 / NBRC 109087 / DQS3-9A1) TaxID=443218 RepID=F6EHB4_HOYSD|nr:Possible transcriptional regulator, TetR family protein [Hoyosella subflava DQS3-9A1]
MQRILDAAHDVLAERGYPDCSTNRIADAAGISKGSLYQYFSDKDDVLVRLADRIAEDITAQISQQIDRNLGPDWQVLASAVLDAVFDAVDRHSPVLRTMLTDAPQLRVLERMESITARAVDVGRTYIALNRTQFREELDVDATLAVLVAGLRAIMSDYVQGTSPIEQCRLKKALRQLTFNALVVDRHQ